MDETERKKWMISEIKRAHQTFVDITTSDMKLYQEEAKKKIAMGKEIRKYILPGLAIIISTLLAITIGAGESIEKVYLLLAIITTASLAVFIISAISIRKYEYAHTSIGRMYEAEILNLRLSLVFFIGQTTDLANISFENVKNYFIFTKLLAFALSYARSEIFEKIYTTHKYPDDFKSILKEGYEDNKKSADLASPLFEEFDKAKLHYPYMLKFIQNTFKDFKLDKKKKA